MVRLRKETFHLQVRLERQEEFKAIAVRCGLIVKRGKYVGEGNASELLSAITQLPDPDKQKLIEMIQMAKTATDKQHRSETLQIPPHKIYAVLGQKGGAGKSTTSGHLAVWFKQQDIPVVFVDADGQASASPWMESLDVPVVQITDPEQLFASLPQLAREYGAVVVDGPGNAGEITKAILTRCDIAIVPNRPSEFDLRSSGKIVQFIQNVREVRSGDPKALIFINAAKGDHSILLREAKAVLEQCRLPLADTIIRDLTCITDAPSQQTTVFQMKGKMPASAAKDYDALFSEVIEGLVNG